MDFVISMIDINTEYVKNTISIKDLTKSKSIRILKEKL
jgi:hypothetical protein